MSGPHPAVAAVRLAVRRALQFSRPGETVLVACSGGADSLALLAATVFEARKPGLRVVGAVVDHGLQDDSAAHTTRVVEQMAALGADETASIRVTVDPGSQGIEAGAREARYAALEQLAEHFGAAAVLLGHTLDDQAETVLLGLTHGSGTRSLQGMRRSFDLFHRPLLEITREQTHAACRAEGIEWWEDPHNSDPRFVRSRIRHTVLPMLEEQLGPGIAETLARTAEQARMDVEFIESSVGAWLDQHPGDLQFEDLDEVGPAMKTRILRRVAVSAGAIPSELTWQHVLALADLDWEDTRQIQLPGHVTAYVDGWFLRFRRTIA